MIEPVAGTIIDDRYRVIRVLGEGGMGTVYLALETELNRTVAIKMLHRGLIADDEHRARFEREGRILSGLSHPNLIKFYRFGLYEKQQPYIAMEFLNGKPLNELLQNPLPLKTQLHIAAEIIAALQFAHNHHVVHRDVKPANVFILGLQESEYHVKVMDFGLARVGEQGQNQGLTRTGELIGSVFYMSPEQCTGKPADQRSDIYSLGCLLFELFTGAPPYTADNPIGLMHKHANDKIPSITKSLPVKSVNGEMAKALDAILHRCLAKSPGDRYQSMQELGVDFEHLKLGRFSDVAAISTSPESNKQPKRLLLATACCTGLLVFLLLSSRWASTTSTEAPLKKSAQPRTLRALSLHARVQDMFRMPPGKARLASAMSLAEEVRRTEVIPTQADLKDIYFALFDEAKLVLHPDVLLVHMNHAIELGERVKADNHLMAILHDRASHLLHNAHRFSKSNELAEKALAELRDSDCIDTELKASALSLICDNTRNLDAVVGPAQQRAVEVCLKEVKAKSLRGCYANLAPELAFIYMYQKAYAKEEKLYEESVSFMKSAALSENQLMIKTWYQLSNMVAWNSPLPRRTVEWLAALKASDALDWCPQAILTSRTLVDNDFNAEALQILASIDITRAPVKSWPVMARAYCLTKARALLSTGNVPAALAEIEKAHNVADPKRPKYNLASDWLATATLILQTHTSGNIDRLLDEYDREILRDTTYGAAKIVGDYAMLITCAPCHQKTSMTAICVRRARSLIAKKSLALNSVAEGKIATLIARDYCLQNNFSKGLEVLEQCSPSRQKILPHLSDDFYLSRAMLLLYSGKTDEAKALLADLLNRKDNIGNTRAPYFIRLQIADVYDATGHPDAAIEQLENGLNAARNTAERVSVSNKLAGLYLNNGHSRKALQLLAEEHPPAGSTIKDLTSLALWQIHYLRYSSALRRSGDPQKALEKAKLSKSLCSVDYRLSGLRSDLEMLFCLTAMDVDTQTTRSALERLLAESETKAREESRQPCARELKMFKGIQLIKAGDTLRGLNMMEACLADSRTPEFYNSLELFKLAKETYLKMGRQELARNCQQQMIEMLTALHGKKFVEIHRRWLDEV